MNKLIMNTTRILFTHSQINQNKTSPSNDRSLRPVWYTSVHTRQRACTHTHLTQQINKQIQSDTHTWMCIWTNVHIALCQPKPKSSETSVVT